jgi:hypothetical protein
MLLDVAGPKPLWIKAPGQEGGAADSHIIEMRYRAAQQIGFADGTHQTSWASWTIASLHREIGQVTVEQMLPQSLGVRGVANTRQSYARTPVGGAWRTNLADPARRPRSGRSAGRPVVVECDSVVRHIGPPLR